MTILKIHVNVFRYLRLHKRVPVRVLDRKFGRGVIRDLIRFRYIGCDGSPLRQDAAGYPIGDYPPDTHFYLRESGLAEIESRDWFDLQYAITSIVLPVVIGVASAVITNLIMSVL